MNPNCYIDMDFYNIWEINNNIIECNIIDSSFGILLYVDKHVIAMFSCDDIHYYYDNNMKNIIKLEKVDYKYVLLDMIKNKKWTYNYIKKTYNNPNNENKSYDTNEIKYIGLLTLKYNTYSNIQKYLPSIVNYNDNVIKNITINNMNVESQDHIGWSILMMMSYQGRIEFIKKLLENNANVNLQNNRNETALMIATYKNHIEIVDILLEHKANVDLQNNRNETALMIATYKNHIEIVDKLFEYKIKFKKN
jgi:ankyrin repeat protein